MNKLARTRAKDPRQEKVRSTKESWNKEVSSFIDNIIHYKKYINGYPSKFNLSRGKITQDLPIEPSKILSMLSSEYEKLASESLEINNIQHEYVSTRQTKHASSKAKRFFSYLKGPFFGDGDEVLKNRYRKNFLSNYADIHDSLKKINSSILSKDPKTVAESKTIFNRFSEDLTILIENFNLAIDEFVPKETKPEAKVEKPNPTDSVSEKPKTDTTKQDGKANQSVSEPGEPKNTPAPIAKEPKEPKEDKATGTKGNKSVGPSKDGPKITARPQALESEILPKSITTAPAVSNENTDTTVNQSQPEPTTPTSPQAEPIVEEKPEDTKPKNPVEFLKSMTVDLIRLDEIGKDKIFNYSTMTLATILRNKTETESFIKYFFGEDYSKKYLEFFSHDFFVRFVVNIKLLIKAFTYLDAIQKSEKNKDFDLNKTNISGDLAGVKFSNSSNQEVANTNMYKSISAVENAGAILKFLEDTFNTLYVYTKNIIVYNNDVLYKFVKDKNIKEEDIKKDEVANKIKIDLDRLTKFKNVSTALGLLKEDGPYAKIVLRCAMALKKTNTGRDYGSEVEVPLLSDPNKMPNKVSDLPKLVSQLGKASQNITGKDITFADDQYVKNAGVVDNTKNYFKKKILQLSFFDKTAPLRLKISELAEEAKEITNKVMDDIHSELDLNVIGMAIDSLLTIQEKMYKLLDVMAKVARNIRPSKDQVRSLLNDRYFYDSEYSDKDLEHIRRNINNKTFRNLL